MKNLFKFILVFCLIALPLTSKAESKFEFEEDNTLPIVYLNIVVDVGAAQDPREHLGLANMSSQMLLRGTQNHTKNEFFKKLDLIGGQFDVEVRTEGTIFRAAVLSENLKEFLDLVSEALTKPSFRAQELAKLKKEIAGLILESKGNDRSLVKYHFYRFLYGKHTYGNPIKGTARTVKKISHKNILNFYSKHFSSKTMALFGTGAADKDVIETWFKGMTKKLDALHPEASPIQVVDKPRINGGRRMLIVNKPKATQAQVLIGGPGLRPEDKGFYEVQLANHSFGGPSFQARLMQEIRVKRGWTYGAYNSFRYGKQPRHFAMYIFPKTSDTPPAVKLTIELFEQFIQNGISEKEFQFAKKALVNNAPFQFDTAKKRLSNRTSEYLMNFPKGYFEDFADNIDDVEYKDLKKSIKANFDAENLVMTVVGDAGKLKAPLTKVPGFKKPVVKHYLKD